MTIIESLSLATPVIGSDLGGIPELISNNYTGLIFKHYEKEELKKNDVNLYLIESDEFKEELDKVNETFSIADAELKAAKAEFEKSGAEYEANEERLSCLNHTIEENSSIANQAEIDKNRLSSQIELLNEQIKSVLASDEQLNKRLDSIKERLLDSYEEKKRLISERFKLTDRLDEMKA